MLCFVGRLSYACVIVFGVQILRGVCYFEGDVFAEGCPGGGGAGLDAPTQGRMLGY